MDNNVKLLILILLFLPLSLKSQIPTDKFNHLTVCAVNSAFVKGISWKLISNKTNWDLKTCHLVSDGLAVGSSMLIGHLKEKHDRRNGGIYSKKDMLFNGLGAIVGAYTIRIIIGNAIPVNRVPIKDVFDMENDPLLTIK
jgi:hypothetical protein